MHIKNKICTNVNFYFIYFWINQNIFDSPSSTTLVSSALSFYDLTLVWMRSLLHQPAILRIPLPVHSLNLRTMATASSSSSSLLFPSVSLNKLSSSRNASSLGFSVTRSKVSMSLSTESQTAINDSLFAHYKPSSAFLFPGQVPTVIELNRMLPSKVWVFNRKKFEMSRLSLVLRCPYTESFV